MNDQEDEEQGICNEVLLAIVSHLFIMLACFLVDLDRSHMDGLIATESNAVPNGDEKPEAKELNQELEEVDIFNLCLVRHFPRLDYFDETIR